MVGAMRRRLPALWRAAHVAGPERGYPLVQRERGMSEPGPPSKSDRIRVLNDNFRSTFIGGWVVMMQGVDALPPNTKTPALLAVQSFAIFRKDNDPRGEHSFGSFEIESEAYFFKLDYYALDMDGRSEDPANP